MEEMYHSCRWCHHYSNGKCLKDIVDVVVLVEDLSIDDKVDIYIKDPDNFYCKEWE